ncbi:hypothetical protein BTO06_09610 [Tenacibaculum sp. SZ-18]|uniref:hypothetical protein n=1 Tax=Tenacibaculum sp. SZ-18 TaxID=754423 RepID=UPI000C2D561F|nr:hypothetical protein [Tenacibaculum sp. SZ-18]AUC15382.1 hypothetical protein BTO06_09610 [Tenacibaculum sp. SZ-18]
MNLILTIVAAVIVAILLAFVIVKFIPLKLRGLVSVLLLLAAGYLVYLIYNGVMEPIKFNKEKKVRYAKVIDQLKLIRDAQIKFKDAKGVFAKDKGSLINFIENDSLVITETINVEKELVLGGGITKKISVKQIDTTGFEPALKYFTNRPYKEMFKVPGTEKEFEMSTGEIEKITGLFVPVFEAKTDKKEILKGLPFHLIKQELEAIEADQIKGEFVSVGSLEEVSTGGNWPPSYDNGDEKTDSEK